MTRKEGIKAQWLKDKSNKQLHFEAVLTTEYRNYVEMCYFCSEQPMPKDKWLEQEIIPAHKS